MNHLFYLRLVDAPSGVHSAAARSHLFHCLPLIEGLRTLSREQLELKHHIPRSWVFLVCGRFLFFFFSCFLRFGRCWSKLSLRIIYLTFSTIIWTKFPWSRTVLSAGRPPNLPIAMGPGLPLHRSTCLTATLAHSSPRFSPRGR